MKNIIILFSVLLLSLNAYAQGGTGKVRKMREEYITNKMHLNADQNARFWSVYNRYLNERSSLRAVYKNQFGNKGSVYDANRYVDDNIEYKQKDLDLSKKYKDELLKVINAQQLAKLYQIERDFKQMLIQTLKDKN